MSQTPAKPTVIGTSENIPRGILFSLLAVVGGIIAWVGLWILGFMASIVAFLIAWLAVKLFKLGAGDISRRSAPAVLAVIVCGIILAFLSGMASDALVVYLEGVESPDWMGTFFTGDFWAFFLGNIFTNGELWGSYAVDIVIAIAFGILGAYGVVKDLFMPGPATEKKA